MQGNWVTSYMKNEAEISGVLLTYWRPLFSLQQPDMASTPFPSDGKYWLEVDFCSNALAIKYKKGQ